MIDPMPRRPPPPRQSHGLATIRARLILAMAMLSLFTTGALVLESAQRMDEESMEFLERSEAAMLELLAYQMAPALEFRKVENARSLNRRVVEYNAVNPPKLQYAIASKVTSTNVAFEVASAALQIFGGNGLSREYPVEKLLRDARASMIEDGCNEMLGIVGAARL